MTTTVSTFFAFERSRLDIVRIQAEFVELQRQTASGLVADDLAGFGTNAGALLNARTLVADASARAEAARLIEPRLATQDSAFSQLDGAVLGAFQAVETALAADDARALRSELETAFGQAVQALNQSFGGVFLFGGERTDRSPLTISTLDELLGLPDAASAFNNSARAQTFDLGGGASAELAPTASALAEPFFTALRDLATFLDAQSELEAPLSPAQQDTLINALAPLRNARDTVLQAQGDNGLLQNRVEDFALFQEQRRDLFTSALGGIADVDLAEVAARLSATTSQFQAAAEVFSQVSNLSLLDFL